VTDTFDEKVEKLFGSAAFSEPQGLGPNSLQYDLGTLRMNAMTRRGGRPIQSQSRRVIVDVREFRSRLPFSLYKRGMEVVPVTLEVGDYILSPDIAVERKSIPDLKGGLATGRLHRQLQVLCRSYKRPILLIEFSKDGPFGLMSSSSMKNDISIQDTTSKIALLTLHFPSVRLIWSKGPDFTACIFDRLKQNEVEPKIDEAVAVGTDKDSQANPDSEVPREILLQIPGLTVHNVRPIINNVQNLLELSRMAKEEIAELIGSSAAAKVHAFLHAVMNKQ